MNKSVQMILAGVVVAALSSSVYARGGEDCGFGEHGPMMGKQTERMQQKHEKQLVKLHDTLKLSAQQEVAWNTFKASHIPPNKSARPDAAEMQKLNTPQRLEKGIERMRALEAKMTAHLTALKEFYATLTPEQQKLFDAKMSPKERRTRSK
jgi:hypothetical protein